MNIQKMSSTNFFLVSILQFSTNEFHAGSDTRCDEENDFDAIFGALFLYHHTRIITPSHSLQLVWASLLSCLLHSYHKKKFFLFQGKFTTKTDVWSFGVTLWEILTFAREQPHESQSDAKILSNLSNIWREGRPTIFLSTPHGCPREVRDLMQECWQREEKERPSFREIHLFLQRKNLGFDPQHCQ